MKNKKEEKLVQQFPCGCYEQMLRMMRKMDESQLDPQRMEELMKEFCDFDEVGQDLKSMIGKMCINRFNKSKSGK